MRAREHDSEQPLVACATLAERQRNISAVGRRDRNRYCCTRTRSPVRRHGAGARGQRQRAPSGQAARMRVADPPFHHPLALSQGDKNKNLNKNKRAFVKPTKPKRGDQQSLGKGRTCGAVLPAAECVERSLLSRAAFWRPPRPRVACAQPSRDRPFAAHARRRLHPGEEGGQGGAGAGGEHFDQKAVQVHRGGLRQPGKGHLRPVQRPADEVRRAHRENEYAPASARRRAARARSSRRGSPASARRRAARTRSLRRGSTGPPCSHPLSPTRVDPCSKQPRRATASACECSSLPTTPLRSIGRSIVGQ